MLLAQLGGTVFSDLNRDLIQASSGEPGIANVAITLTGKDSTETPVSLSTTTDASGNYLFTGLNASDSAGYTVTESSVSGYYHEGEVVGSTGGSHATQTITTVLTSSSSSTGNNFAEELPTAISGFVYVDANNNGVDDAGETALSGVSLHYIGITDIGGVVSGTTTTSSTGAYSFSNLRPGAYTMYISRPAGFLNGLSAQGGSVVGGSQVYDFIGGISPAPGATSTNKKDFSGASAGHAAGSALPAPMPTITAPRTAAKRPSPEPRSRSRARTTWGPCRPSRRQRRPMGRTASATFVPERTASP